MKCETVKTELPGLLFGELSEDERERLMAHIAQCDECRREWMELKATEAVMLEWKEEEPVRDIVFVADEKEALWKRLIDSILAPGLPRWGFAAAILLIALWIAKPNFTVKDGSFTFAFGKPAPASAVDNETLQTLLRNERIQIIQMVSDILAANNEDLRRDYTLTLAAFARDLDRQRTTDRNWMQTGLNDMERMTQAGFMQTNMVIEDMLKRASLNNGSVERSGQ